MGYGGCEPRIEGIVQCIKRYCTILRKWGGGEGQYLNPKHYVFKKEKRKKKEKKSKKKKKKSGPCGRVGKVAVFQRS